MRLIDVLKANAEASYADFSASLTPGVERARFLGVRIPLLRKISRQFQRENDTTAFMHALPHRYIEEDLIHAFLINTVMDMSTLQCELDRFLPYVDNWLVCDALRPKLFQSRKMEALEAAAKWMRKTDTYTVRFGIEVYMVYGLGEAYQKSDLHAAADLESDQYYVQMMQAWYLATALSMHEEDVLEVLPGLYPIVRKMTIQKAIDSRRISDALKRRLKAIRKNEAKLSTKTGNCRPKVRK